MLYQLYEAREERRNVAREVLGKITVDKINEFCAAEKDTEKQKVFAAQQLAVYESAIASM